MLQYKWTMKTLCSVQEVRQKRPHFVQFHLYVKNQLTVKDPDAGKD